MNLFEEYTYLLSNIDLDKPNFKNKTRKHDWRNYVPYEWQDKWVKFTERERQIIAVMAQMQADNEEWD